MDVIIESGSRRTFAAVVDWPGWCRSGRDEDTALDVLADYRPRYAPVVATAGLDLPQGSSFTVIERLPGKGATDFGVPHEIAEADRHSMSESDTSRQVALLREAWEAFDGIAADAPPVLRKGPRGGGRDRDEVIEHVLESEATYARKIGIKQRAPAPHAPVAVATLRDAIADRLSQPTDGSPLTDDGWPARYAFRRIAWHVLDHAWEIEDKSGSGA